MARNLQQQGQQQEQKQQQGQRSFQWLRWRWNARAPELHPRAPWQTTGSRRGCSRDRAAAGSSSIVIIISSSLHYHSMATAGHSWRVNVVMQ